MFQIQKLLEPYDKCGVECDGLTRIMHTILVQQGIEHTVFMGYLSDGKTTIPHLWIDLPSGERIDYRANMWLDGENVPHGIFNPQDFSHIQYIGEEIEIEILSPRVLALLTGAC